MADKKDGKNGKSRTAKKGTRKKVVQYYKRVDFEQGLECVLTPEEISVHSAEAADDAAALSDFDTAEAYAKAQAASAKKEGEVKLSHMKGHLRCVSTGREHKSVKCYRQYDPDTAKVETYRIDTGALIDTRGAIGKEDQPELMRIPSASTKVVHSEGKDEGQEKTDSSPAGS